MKTNNLSCKNNKLYKIDKNNQLIYYKDISHLKKDIRNIYEYIISKQKKVDIGYCLPEIFRFQNIVTIYIDRAYKLIKKNNEILNI
jgi:hypothetical protein